jgi:Asp-tRNA(Asn)/Glu-tRNA(Gln) amidotransferase A subunit family amidase
VEEGGGGARARAKRALIPSHPHFFRLHHPSFILFSDQLVDICLPELELVRCAQVVTIAAELAQAWKWALADGRQRRRLTAETRISLAQAARLSATDYLQALRIRTRLMTHVGRLFGVGAAEGGGGGNGARGGGVCDLIVAPTCGVVAPKAPPPALRHGATDLRQAGELMRFTIPVNMAGLPAMSVPVGHGEGGLPVGLQLIGRPWDEAGLLGVAAALEGAATGRLRPPGLRWDLLAPRAAVQ